METLKQDVSYAVRMLLNKRGLTVVAVLTLALGIGSNTAIFSVVDAVLLRQLSYLDSARLVWIWATRTDRDKAFYSRSTRRYWPAASGVNCNRLIRRCPLPAYVRCSSILPRRWPRGVST